MADQLAVFANNDAVMVLDSGRRLPFHSDLLELRSQPLADTIALAAESTKDKHHPRHVPLPSTPDEEAQLLLTVAYSQRPERLLHSWDKLQLLALACLCHRFAMQQLLAMIDEAGTHALASRVNLCSSWLCRVSPDDSRLLRRRWSVSVARSVLLLPS